LKSAWNKHGFFNVTGSTVQKIGREVQADFFREVGGAYEYFVVAGFPNPRPDTAFVF